MTTPRGALHVIAVHERDTFLRLLGHLEGEKVRVEFDDDQVTGVPDDQVFEISGLVANDGVDYLDLDVYEDGDIADKYALDVTTITKVEVL